MSALELMVEIQASLALIDKYRAEFKSLRGSWLLLESVSGNKNRMTPAAASLLALNELKAAHQRDFKKLFLMTLKNAQHVRLFGKVAYDLPKGTVPEMPEVSLKKLSGYARRTLALEVVKPYVTDFYFRRLEALHNKLIEHDEGTCEREWVEGNPLECQCDQRALRGEFFMNIKHCFWAHINRLGQPLTEPEADVFEYVNHFGPLRTRS